MPVHFFQRATFDCIQTRTYQSLWDMKSNDEFLAVGSGLFIVLIDWKTLNQAKLIPLKSFSKVNCFEMDNSKIVVAGNSDIGEHMVSLSIDSGEKLWNGVHMEVSSFKFHNTTTLTLVNSQVSIFDMDSGRNYF